MGLIFYSVFMYLYFNLIVVLTAFIHYQAERAMLTELGCNTHELNTNCRTSVAQSMHVRKSWFAYSYLNVTWQPFRWSQKVGKIYQIIVFLPYGLSLKRLKFRIWLLLQEGWRSWFRLTVLPIKNVYDKQKFFIDKVVTINFPCFRNIKIIWTNFKRRYLRKQKRLTDFVIRLIQYELHMRIYENR